MIDWNCKYAFRVIEGTSFVVHSAQKKLGLKVISSASWIRTRRTESFNSKFLCISRKKNQVDVSLKFSFEYFI
ncbi:hypothetical protein Plhal304r1_c002g0005981 [Plasmopara halstedii]